MCLTCGCATKIKGAAHDEHGQPGHLTYAHVAGSAALDGISVKKAGKRIAKALKADRKQHPDEYNGPSPADVPPPPG